MPASLPAQARNAAAWPRVLDLVAEGHSLREVCRMPGMPSRSTVHRWTRQDRSKAEALARAMEWRLMWLVDEATERIDAWDLRGCEAIMRRIGRMQGGERTR